MQSKKTFQVPKFYIFQEKNVLKQKIVLEVHLLDFKHTMHHLLHSIPQGSRELWMTVLCWLCSQFDPANQAQ